MINRIAFPGLGLGPFSIHESFSFFGLTIHWYGVLIATGLFLAYLFAKKKAKKREIASDTLIDIILWGLPSALICARAYYVIFSWAEYKDNFLDVFKIWEGGIAIYGAIIGAVASTAVYCHVKKIPIWRVLDIGSFGLLIGQSIGRWGNFVNAEAYGGETSSLFRMQLLNLGISVHPTFLYESMWNVCLFIVLNLFEKHQKFDGQLFLLYVTGYGAGRFLIEGLRQDSLWLGPIRISQLVALICVIVGIVLLILGKKRSEKLKIN